MRDSSLDLEIGMRDSSMDWGIIPWIGGSSLDWGILIWIGVLVWIGGFYLGLGF